ncbi:MAG: hypothetical protein LBK60_00880 [Verrucomicrobiales bacterium]|nr:hypothetical protein [Verrucomicrobiales bacterium]
MKSNPRGWCCSPRAWLVASAVALALMPGAWWLNDWLQVRLLYGGPLRYPATFSKAPRGFDYATSAGRQTAFYLPPADGQSPERLWVIFSGHGSLAAWWLPLLDQARVAGTGFLLVDYPGFGFCTGRPSPARIQESADGALAALRERGVTPARLGVAGYSLGTGPALQFATRHDAVERVLLLAPYTSVSDLQQLFYGLRTPWLLRHEFDNRAAMTALAARATPPTVIIVHGEKDDTVPPVMGRELAGLLPTAVFHSLPDAGHGTIVAEAAWWLGEWEPSTP